MRSPKTSSIGHDRTPERPQVQPQMSGENTATTVPVPVLQPLDAVDASGADSFPASDPPGWWAGR